MRTDRPCVTLFGEMSAMGRAVVLLLGALLTGCGGSPGVMAAPDAAPTETDAATDAPQSADIDSGADVQHAPSVDAAADAPPYPWYPDQWECDLQVDAGAWLVTYCPPLPGSAYTINYGSDDAGTPYVCKYGSNSGPGCSFGSTCQVIGADASYAGTCYTYGEH